MNDPGGPGADGILRWEECFGVFRVWCAFFFFFFFPRGLLPLLTDGRQIREIPIGVPDARIGSLLQRWPPSSQPQGQMCSTRTARPPSSPATWMPFPCGGTVPSATACSLERRGSARSGCEIRADPYSFVSHPAQADTRGRGTGML